MFTLDYSMKGRFFDRANVVKQISIRERRALSRMGAFIRQRAKTDVLRRTLPYGHRRKTGRGRDGRYKRIRQSSPPGSPPVVHSRDSHATLKKILFALGPNGQSVIIGPVGIPRLRLQGSTARTVPELLEFGGTATITEHQYEGSQIWFPGSPSRDKSGSAKTRRRKVKYAAHPFMSEAGRREAKAGHLVDAFSFGTR